MKNRNDDFDGYRKWLGISSKKRPPTHYDILGIKLDEDDEDVIRAAADQRRHYVESKRGMGRDALVAEILMRIDEAAVTLLSHDMRRDYDKRLSLFEKRRRNRRVDPNVTATGYESRPGRVVGEEPTVVKTFAGIMVVICLGFGIMAWFSFQLPWDRQPKNLGTGNHANENPLDKGEGVLLAQRQGNLNPDQGANTDVAGGQKASVSSTDSAKSTNKSSTEVFAGNTAGERKELLPHIAFRWCPPGTFTMGSPQTELNRGKTEDQVSVTLSSGFWLSETEVTQGQWERLMGTTPWKSKNNVKMGEDFAACFVSWNDSTAYCEKLTSQEREAKRLPEGWKYSLPTEAQWEYACRAGTTTSHSFGERIPSESYSWMSDYGWYDGNVNEGSQDAHPQQVGKKKPNPWGLFDMHGNVWEWCLDWKSQKLMGGIDPSGPASGSKRVRRGGGWGSGILHSRSADRDQDSPDRQWPEIGFRIAAVPSTSLNSSGVVDNQTVRATEAPNGTYIVKLPQMEIRHQNHWWSVNGETILGGINGEPLIRRPLMFDGQTSSHSIYMHARPSDDALVTYRLEGKFETFESTVLVPDMLPNQGDPRTPLTFKLVGDGRSLWRSKPLGKKGDFEVCHASVSGIKDLSLVINCPGPENWGLAAWVEPQVSVRATGAEGKSNTRPKPVLRLSFDPTQTPGARLELHGAKYVDGIVGKALEFDGNSFAIVNHNIPIGNSPRSLAVWLKNTRGPVEKELFHAITQGPVNPGTVFGIMEAGGKWRFFDFNGGLGSGIQIDRSWHHHCITFDGTTITYFFDGARVSSVARSLNTTASPLLLGTLFADNNEKRFKGIIDELVIFDVPLTDDQVRELAAK